MTVVDMSKYGGVGGKLPALFDIRLGDALADLCRERWPNGTRKAVAKEWGLTTEQARSVCEGSAAKATLELIFRHHRGRWPLILEVFARYLGEGVDQHLERERRRHAERAEQLGEVVRDFRAAVHPRRGADPRDAVRVAGRMGAQSRELGRNEAQGD